MASSAISAKLSSAKRGDWKPSNPGEGPSSLGCSGEILKQRNICPEIYQSKEYLKQRNIEAEKYQSRQILKRRNDQVEKYQSREL
jgi:hypothetical protein